MPLDYGSTRSSGYQHVRRSLPSRVPSSRCPETQPALSLGPSFSPLDVVPLNNGSYQHRAARSSAHFPALPPLGRSMGSERAPVCIDGGSDDHIDDNGAGGRDGTAADVANDSRWWWILAVLGTTVSCNFGAEDGIRTRDPHLGKVVISVGAVASGPPPCRSVHPVSTRSIESGPVVERSTTSRRTQA